MYPRLSSEALGNRSVWSQHARSAREWLDTHPHHRAKTMSLTAMAESTVGKPLNKALQTSDWGARPLSPKQLQYAALDAHVCLQIYATLCKQDNILVENFVTTWPH